MLLGLCVLAACVTVNIYFPAAAAEKAADQIIDDVWGSEAKGVTAPALQSLRQQDTTQLGRHWEGVIDLVISPALAQQGDINVNTPGINALKNAMSARFPQLQPYFDSGGVGLTGDGLVTIRDRGAIPLDKINAVNQLVAAENADRNALYQQIAAANGHPEWASQIRSTFARQWVANARPGWWYQGPDGAWRQK
jgi:uncharacterized protein YdbL (DUF1318 family)